MWGDGNSPAPAKGCFLTPPPTRKQTPPKTWTSEKITNNIFHVLHKVPASDSPYVKAKHVQLIEKDPGRAVSLFWSAINAGDRVDSALKDMAIVMKQLNRSEEAIEAIKSFRHLCSDDSQESLDNVLVELYKSSGKLEEQIQILQQKLKCIEGGNAFGGRRVKLARSQGKKVQITIEQEYVRILGNLAWAYLQQNDFKASEEYYRKALSIEFDRNKQCNLAICLMSMNKMIEAKFLLQTIQSSSPQGKMDESYGRSFERASELLAEVESQSSSTENDKENRCQSGGPYKRPYETSRNNRGWNTSYTPKVQSPFTQPRRRCTELNSKSWKPEINKNKPLNCLHRRLQFEGFQDSKFSPSRDPERKCSENQQKKANVSAENTQSKGACDRTFGNDEEDVPIYKGTKKSWADMAEEDEEESMKDLLSSSFWKTFT